MQRLVWLNLIAATVLALLGGVFGYASAEHYGWVLRLWLCLSAASATLLIVAIARGAGAAKVSAAVVLALIVLVGISPAYRHAHVGLFSP
jgi:hypothetical protein